MIRKAAYQSVVVVDPTINKQNSIQLQQQQPSLLPLPSALLPQRVVHKVPIYLVQRSRSVLVKDLEKILGPGRSLQSVQAEDGTILLHALPSITASTITATSRPTFILVRDSRGGRTKYRNEHDKEEEEGEEKEDLWFIHPTLATTTAPLPPAVPSLSLIESQADTAATVVTAGPSIPSCPCSCSGSCSSSTSTSSLPQLQQQETEQGGKSRGEFHHHDQQANKDQTARAEPPTPTQMTTRNRTFSEQQQKVQFEPKVEQQTRPFRATMSTSGQSSGDPWTRSRIKRSTLQHEDEEEDALGAVAVTPRESNGERGSGEGGDNDEHDDVEAVKKRGEDVNCNNDFSVPASPSSSSSLTFPPPPDPIPTLPSPSMASTSASATSLPPSTSSLPTSPSTDTMLMRQQLLEMANALVSIADRGDDVGQDRDHARTLALQVLESYTLALAESTSLPLSSDKTNTSPPPSLSMGVDTRHGLITPDATPQSTPVITSSYLLSSPNTDTRPNNDTIVTSLSSTPFSPPSAAFLSYQSPTLVTRQIPCPPVHPDIGTDFCTSPRSSICSLPPPSLNGQDQCAQPDPNIDQHLQAGSCVSLPSASQSFTASLPPTPIIPTTIPDSRKGSKDGNKTRLSRMLRSNSVKNPFGGMFGSIKVKSSICGSDQSGKRSLTTAKEQKRKGSADSGGSSSQGTSSSSSSHYHHRGSSGHEEDNQPVLTSSAPASAPASSTTPWYKIQQRRRESRANSASESGSGSRSNSINSNKSSSNSSGDTTTTATASSAPFGFHGKSSSKADTRQRATVSHVPSQPQQQQQRQQLHAHRPSHQHPQHPQQHQQPLSYCSSARTLQVQVQPQRHFYSADARLGGGRSVTRTATGSFFDSVSDSDSDEEIAHPTYLQQQRQYQPHYQHQQLQDQGRDFHRMSYPSASAAPPVSLASMSGSSRSIQSDPRTQQRLRQQEEEQERRRSRYQVYDSDEDSDSEDEDDSELDVDEDEDEDEDEDDEEGEERLQRPQRQPYTPPRVLVDPESLEGYIHRFDEAPPPSYHSLIRSGTVSVNPSVAGRIESHPLAHLSQLLELLHHFKDHVLDTFKTLAFQIKGLPSSSSTTTPPASPTLESASSASDRHHYRRESWQSRRPQTVASFAYLLIEFEQSGLLFPPNATLFLISAASSPTSLFCRSEQDWLANTGNATTVSQLAMALLALEQTCQDQAMMALDHWHSSSARDQWILQVQSLSTTA